jgi:probable blue pigment (indigoidine) exporter
LMVIALAHFLLDSPIRPMAIVSAVVGLAGIAVLVITPEASLDPVGLAAGTAGAISMAFGTVLTRRWQPKVSLLTFTSWQLVAGGLLLLPAAMWLEPPLPSLNQTNILGFLYLGLIGAALTYILWFRGLSRLDASTVSTLGFLSPITAVIIGWLFLEQSLNSLQLSAAITVFISIWLSQFASRTLAEPEKSAVISQEILNYQQSIESIKPGEQQ